jgi:uncharacterized membrane protein
MPCNKECNQGRSCNCDRSTDRATVVICALVLVAVVAMGYGVYKLLNTAGQECAIEVQFKDSKATYIGTTV